MNVPFSVQDLGVLNYHDALQFQHRIHAEVAAGTAPPTLLLVEHPAVITLGRKAKEGNNIIVPKSFLALQGIEIYEIERGGDVTYHGLGQLVGYPIFPVGRKVRDFLRLIEDALVQTLASYALPAYANPGYAGVYVDPRDIGGRMLAQKIASIGVAVKRHVAFHGFALNVHTQLEHFDLIVPCGLQDTQMTSIHREFALKNIGTPPHMAEVKERIIEAFARVFELYHFSLEGVR